MTFQTLPTGRPRLALPRHAAAQTVRSALAAAAAVLRRGMSSAGETAAAHKAEHRFVALGPNPAADAATALSIRAGMRAGSW